MHGSTPSAHGDPSPSGKGTASLRSRATGTARRRSRLFRDNPREIAEPCGGITGDEDAPRLQCVRRDDQIKRTSRPPGPFHVRNQPSVMVSRSLRVVDDLGPPLGITNV